MPAHRASKPAIDPKYWAAYDDPFGLSALQEASDAQPEPLASAFYNNPLDPRLTELDYANAVDWSRVFSKIADWKRTAGLLITSTIAARKHGELLIK